MTVDASMLKKSDIAKLLGISLSTVERMERSGELPRRFAPLSRARRVARWRRDDIDAYLRRGAA